MRGIAGQKDAADPPVVGDLRGEFVGRNADQFEIVGVPPSGRSSRFQTFSGFIACFDRLVREKS